MKRKLTAGPTPDGTFITRRTNNDYSHAVVVISEAEKVYKPRAAGADDFGYVANPDLGKWVSLSWHTRYDLACTQMGKLRNQGRRHVCIVAVVPSSKIHNG